MCEDSLPAADAAGGEEEGQGAGKRESEEAKDGGSAQDTP